MSAPSSNGRRSGDSDRWTASSNTYIARNSGASYTDNGEGGSSPRRSQDSRPDTGATTLGSASPLVRGSVQDEDVARRKQRLRRSGGFLLDSTFASGPRQRHAHQDARTEDPKGKRSSRKDGRQERVPRTRLSPPHSPGASGIDVADSQGMEMDMDTNRVHVARARQRAYEMQSPAIDPNQLVHMALNLSESRRRHINAGQLMASQPRAASGAQREGSFSNYGTGSSLRQYLNEQRRASRNISPMGKSSPTRHMSTSIQRSGSIPFLSSQTVSPSAATLARVDKARAYIELQVEYLRLLEYLPPLKPDANAPGNFVVSSNNVPGSPQAQLTRVPSYAGKQHELGRPYNPLQYIRNRRSRARERLTLDHPSEEFEHVEHVHEWVDRVEQYAKHVAYRRDDAVQLPKLHHDHEVSPTPSKSARPHKGWLFTPQELLADAHWLEQGDNKMLVENRHGRKIFPPKEAQQKDLLHPRASIETSDKRRKSWIDGLPSIALDPTTGDESDKGSERGRKRRLLPALRTDSPKGGKHSRRGSRLRTHDDSDSSGSESDARKRKIRVITDPDHNTGPLALLLEQQAKQYQDKSPAFISPDTPNKWGRDNEDIISESKPSRNSLEVPRPTNGFAYIKDHGNFKVPPKPRPKSSLTINNIEPRSSLDNQDSTAPSTPHAKQFGYIGSDPSSPASRSGSQTRKSRRSKFNNIFHSHEHHEEHKEHKHELRPDTPEADKKGRSRQTSDETSDEKNIGTAILAAPGAVMNLLGHRKNDSVSSLPSPDKLRRRETQEPHSAVTRFFKGVKNEGTKVGDIIFRRDRADDSDSDTLSDRNSVEFDDDVATKAKHAKRPPINRITTADTEGSVTSLHKDRNHLDLPSFRPIHPIDDENSDLEHHISRQAREQKGSRSPRLDRLLPPRMDLGTISGNSSQDSLGSIHGKSQDRMNQALARPGVTGEDLPLTGLRNVQAGSRQRSGSRPGPNGRHWSITDNGDHDGDRKNNANMVTQADIARVRALFLCSGVKAKEIVRRAHAQRTPPEFLLCAAATSKVQLYPVSIKEEHVLAARILVKDLESSTRALQSTLECFRDKAIQQLTNQISNLQSTVDSDLMPRILEGGDEAVRITSEVSGRGPLQVKQITDEIDRMIRARRRRMRWVRSFGWMLVEWGLVAVMWCVWLIVVLVGSVKRVFGMGLGFIRWLMWL